MQDWRYLRFEKGTRYYELRLELDLLEHWVISAINGRIRARLGRIVVHCYKTKFDADIVLEKMVLYRIQRRKYKLVYFEPKIAIIDSDKLAKEASDY